MRWKNNLVLISVPALVLASCGIFASDTGEAQTRKSPAADSIPVFKVAQGDSTEDAATRPPPLGDKVNYDEVGYASWYGDELRGNPTASGEIFNPEGVSAAHNTLPLPSFAEVTNLDSGRTILVRVNDRGPSKRGRIIDISAGAAKQLGVTTQGQFPVRVRRVNPPEFERRQLQNGGAAAERLATPPSLLAALRRNLKPGEVSPTVASTPNKVKPVTVPPVATTVANSAGAQFDPPDATPMKAKPKPAAVALPDAPIKRADVSTSTGNYFIQIGAFSSQARADALAKKAGGSAISAGPIWRVRVGPYETEESARAALGPLGAKGYRDARVTR